MNYSQTNYHSAWTNLCLPAKINVVFGCMHVLYSAWSENVSAAIVGLLSTVLGTLILGMLCAAGLDIIAYIFVFFPILAAVTLGAFMVYQWKSGNLVPMNTSSTTTTTKTITGTTSASASKTTSS